ncbi:MAG: cystathionine gamma-synthase [Bdellovibrionales bacterium]
MEWPSDKYGFETRAIHAGQEPDPSTGAIMTPIYMTSTFVQSSPGVHKGYDYSRAGNPTRTAYENCLANLESGKYGIAFSSGCAATATIAHLLKQGDHVVCFDDVYGGTFRLFDKVISNNGVQFTYVDLRDLNKLEDAVKPNTKLIWIETPTNPLLKLADIEAIAKFAKAKNILTAVDNTFMSPYFQRPLELGADMVVHSTTKYINGHSDIIGGAVVVNRDDLAEKLYFLQKSIGAVPGNFDSYICMRSLKTLAVRMQAHEQNGRGIAHFLEEHSAVKQVIYPGLESHPQHALAKSQMHGFGGMITFFMKGGLKAAKTVLENVNVFALAESLGGVESLIEHPGIMTHASVPAEQRAKLGIDDSMIRISVGIERLDDLIWDLDSAFKKL